MSGVHVRTNMWEIEREGGGSYIERERERKKKKGAGGEGMKNIRACLSDSVWCTC